MCSLKHKFNLGKRKLVKWCQIWPVPRMIFSLSVKNSFLKINIWAVHCPDEWIHFSLVLIHNYTYIFLLILSDLLNFLLTMFVLFCAYWNLLYQNKVLDITKHIIKVFLWSFLYHHFVMVYCWCFQVHWQCHFISEWHCTKM